jgi:AcrR family transcriptional regulator
MQHKIVVGAIELIHREGIDKFSMRRLAAHLGMSTRPIYYYFKNSADLYAAIATEVLAELQKFTSASYTADSFLNSGVGYVLFARELPHYYHTLSLQVIWPQQSFTSNDVDDHMRSHASAELIKIYDIMKTYTIGMALLASSLPHIYTKERIIQDQTNLFHKLTAHDREIAG